MSTPERLLEEALALTQRMLALANKDEWEEVKALEEKQRELLHACFESGKSIGDRALTAKQVQKILDLHQKIIETSAESTSRITQELSQFQKGRNAIRAYLDNS